MNTMSEVQNELIVKDCEITKLEQEKTAYQTQVSNSTFTVLEGPGYVRGHRSSFDQSGFVCTKPTF